MSAWEVLVSRAIEMSRLLYCVRARVRMWPFLGAVDTGAPGGKETGQSVTHYIVPAGRYAKAYAKLKATGLTLHWESAPYDHEAKAKKAASKTKFTCPECGQNAWAKPDAALICGDCYDDGEGDICLLVAEAMC